MKLYNTLSRKVEEVKPLQDNLLKIYTCGLTVYSQPQIGNWVAYIYSDVLTRVLRSSGYKVKRVQNITDVGHLVSDDDSGEDKMEKGARVEGSTAWDIADKYIDIANREAYEMLGLLRPDQTIRATSLIKEQIEFVKQLEEKGFTYTIPKEGIYFDTSKISDYGKLARLDIDGLQAGARVDIKGKKYSTDFALWKFSPENQRRDMEWDSPWGKGFPGWHLECSVIARESLGNQIDIHTGGIDHIPVHHTNEIAQTESLTGKQFVSYWFHNNHMKINGSKMAKSSGNSYILNDILDRGFSLEAFKLMVLSSHYRTEGNFTWDILDASSNRYKHWQSIVYRIWQPLATQESNIEEILKIYSDKILKALQNDLDTPEALRLTDELISSIETRPLSSSEATALKIFFQKFSDLTGIIFDQDDLDAELKSLIKEREMARVEKNWEKSDALRDNLREANIELEDTGLGTYWSRV